MSLSSEVYISILAEALFILLVIALIRIAFIRQRARSLERRVETHESMIIELTDKLAKAQVMLKKAATASRNQPAEERLLDIEQQLISYKQRVGNLERFRDLYFELEEQCGSTEDANEDDPKFVELYSIINAQEKLISQLTEKISRLSSRVLEGAEEYDELLSMTATLERNSDRLSCEVEGLERVKSRNQVLQKELEHYRERANQLEETERNLLKESKRYRDEFASLGNAGRKPAYGQVKVVEIERMARQLEQKEAEIRRLRQECETVAKQYEALAVSSMKNLLGADDIPQQHAADLQQLKQSLEQSMLQLSQKQSECEQLENLYLQLKDESSKSSAEQVQQSMAECKALETQVHELAEQAESLSVDGQDSPLAKIRAELKQKEDTLMQVRQSYHELKTQFIDVANEDEQLKRDYGLIKQENASLRMQVQEMQNQIAKVGEKDTEINTLRAELGRIEERYLKLVEKSRHQ